MAAEDEAFDLVRLEKELETAVEVEVRRQRVDDMKKRAIHSAGSYDEFKNLVACAHQKPIASGEMENAFKTGPRSHNRAMAGSKKLSKKVTKARTFGAAGKLTAPRTSMEFQRDWRRHCKTAEARYNYLRLLQADQIPAVFKTEVNSDLLVQIAAACSEVLPGLAAAKAADAGADGADGADDADAATTGARGAGVGAGAEEGRDGQQQQQQQQGPGSHASFVAAVLKSFSTVSRFGLTIKLLSKKDKAVLQSLLDVLTAQGAGDAVAELATAYGLA